MNYNKNMCRVSITQDRIVAIIPEEKRPQGKVSLYVISQTDDSVVINIRPDDNGVFGSSAANSSPSYKGYWSYEQRRLYPKRDGFTIFGRTEAVVETSEDGTIIVRNNKPIRSIRNRGALKKTRKSSRAKKIDKIIEEIKQQNTHGAHNINPVENFPDVDVTSLRALVTGINKLKTELGANLVLSINPDTGRLRALVE